MRLCVLTFACATLATGCYSGGRAARDVNVAWRGHASVDLKARLGEPQKMQAQADGNQVLRWIARGRTIERLPGGRFDLDVTPTSFDLYAEAHPGVMRDFESLVATALVDPRGQVLQFDADWLAAGIPSGLNLRTGIVMGVSGGMGRLDDAASPLPSVGAYIGGMLGPRLALVGAYAFVNGKSDGDYVQGHSWALAAQYWPMARLALRAGPAMVLDTDPGPGGVDIAPGAVGAVSFAVIRAGSFVLDARVDATVSTASSFGTVGVGVNLN